MGLEDDDTLLLKEDRTLKDSGIGERDPGGWRGIGLPDLCARAPG